LEKENKYCGLKSTVFDNPEKFVSQISGTQEMLSAFLRELLERLSFIFKLKFTVF